MNTSGESKKSLGSVIGFNSFTQLIVDDKLKSNAVTHFSPGQRRQNRFLSENYEEKTKFQNFSFTWLSFLLQIGPYSELVVTSKLSLEKENENPFIYVNQKFETIRAP